MINLLYYYLITLVITGILYLTHVAIVSFTRKGRYETKVRKSYIDKYMDMHSWDLKSDKFFMAMYYYIPFLNIITSLNMVLVAIDRGALKEYSYATAELINWHIEENYGEYLNIGKQQYYNIDEIRLYAIKMAVKENKAIKSSKKKKKKSKKDVA